MSAVSRRLLFPLLALLAIVGAAIPLHTQAHSRAAGALAIRVGYFPNITHAQAVLGFGDGSFARGLAGVSLRPEIFNAGPDELNALFAGAIDIGYMGPGPAINGYVRSQGGLYIISGASTGGALLVARAGSGIKTVKDLTGKTVAVPQLGNTQDIELRALLGDAGLAPSERGGSVRILAVQNADTLSLFQKGDLDAALVPEPWGSRLVAATGARVVLDWNQIYGGTTPGAVVVVAASFLKAHPDLVVRFLRIHEQFTRELRSRSAAIAAALNAQIKTLTGKALPAGVLASALTRTSFTTNIDQATLSRFAALSASAGYLRKGVSVTGVVNHWPLDHLQDASIK